MIHDNEVRQLFREEVDETLAELDAALLELEKTPNDEDLVNRIFRAVHTLKGACDMFGVAPVVETAHRLESVFDAIRSGRMTVDKNVLDAGFSAKDTFAAMLAEGADPAACDATGVMEALDALLHPADPEPAPEPEPKPVSEDRSLFTVTYAPADPSLRESADIPSLFEQLGELGDVTLVADLTDVPPLEQLDPDHRRISLEATVETDRNEDDVRDIFIIMENPGDIAVERVSGPTDNEPAPAEAPVPAPAPLPKPRAEPKQKTAPPVKQRAVQSLRVDAGKLDELVNLVGELVIAQARLTQLAGQIIHPALTGVAEEIERLSNELRDNTLGIRMLPIGTTFSRFRRLVRDLSSEMHKQIELVTEGGETELDKTVIEQLNDPLVHLLRNSIDHGVESPDERTAAGKPAKGRIVLSAEHAGGEVLIRITDDGRGMDPAFIRGKALDKGLIAPDARLSDAECFNLIFLPGFSTAKEVTNISGRGVGMDVVKRSMDALRGKIEIQSSPGRGAEITVKLPLTLAIIDGLQVMVGEGHYIIPLSMVEECVELAAGNGSREKRKRTVQLRGEIVPYVRLRETFGIDGDRPDIEQIVVTRNETSRIGIAVDEVVGQQQTVIKSLGAYIGNVEGVSGATINGDGTMSLILDVPTLVQSVKRGRV